MEARFPTTAEVQVMHAGDLAVLLSDVDPGAVRGWGAEEVEAVVVATGRVASWAAALQTVGVDRFTELVEGDLAAHVAELAAAKDRPCTGAAGGVPVGVPEAAAVAAASLAPLLNLSPRTMRTRVERARVLGELPATAGLALEGRLEPWRVDAVVAAAADLPWEAMTEFEARLYATDVSGLPKPRLAERARASAAKADPDAAARVRAAAPRRRGLRVTPHPEVAGLMRWSADLPDATSRTLLAAVDELAGEYLAADDVARATARAAGAAVPATRSVAAARVDALADLALANATVETIVELVVPADVAARAATTTMVERPDPGQVVRDAFRPPRGSRAGDTDAAPGGGGGRGPVPDDPVPDDPMPVDPVPVDPVLVDLVAGRHTAATLAAGALEVGLGLALGEHLEVAGNPFITLTPPGATSPPGSRTATGQPVWFVPGVVQAPGTSGLLPADVVALLSDPDVRLRVTGGPVGSVDGDAVRRRTYRPGKALAEKVRARDRHCRFPGCSVPARRCQLDHVVRHPDGETVEANLTCLCPAHHAFKHHAGWRLTMTPDGTCTWTAPTGREHRTEPGTRYDTAA